MKKTVIFMLFAFWAVAAFSQDAFNETIVVEGKSKMSMRPEIVHFNINFTVEDSSFVRCSELALEKISEIKNEFIDNDIDTSLIETINYSVREKMKYEERRREQVFDGYIAGIPVSIKTKLDNPASAKIFDIIKRNFKSNLQINFELSENQQNQLKDELIKLAVEDATAKARILTESLDVKLGRILKIQYGDPQLISNFTRAGYDLVSSRQLQTVSATQATFNALTPAAIVMTTNVMLAWSIEK